MIFIKHKDGVFKGLVQTVDDFCDFVKDYNPGEEMFIEFVEMDTDSFNELPEHSSC